MSTFVERMAAALHTDAGHRILHARGTWVTGSFTPSPDARRLTDARLFVGGKHRFTGRFSGNRGHAAGHDADTGDQGFAVRLTDGHEALDLMMFTLPVFFVRTGADLLAFMEAVTPSDSGDPPDKALLTEFVAKHPEARAALSAVPAGAAASYLDEAYHAIHAYGLTRDGHTSRVRFVLEPQTAAPRLDPTAAHTLPSDYLQADLIRRVPATFRLHAHHPAPSDAVHDPTAPWSGQRRTELGTLTVETATPDPPHDPPQFDPLILPAGVDPPLDQLVRDRSDAYQVARRLRSGGG